MSNTRNLRDATLKIVDGTADTPLYLEIPIMDGDLSWSEKHPTMIVKNRGKIDSRKEGDEEAMEVSFSFLFEQYQFATGEATGVSVHDALYGTGGAAAEGAAWVSTDSCGPYAIDLEFTIANPCADGEAEVLTFPKFHADKFDFKEASEANKCTVSGSSLAQVPGRDYTGP